MPSTSGKIPLYRLHKARNLAVVTLDGKNYYLGPFGSPEIRREYGRLIAEWLAAHRNAPARVGDPEDRGLAVDKG